MTELEPKPGVGSNEETGGGKPIDGTLFPLGQKAVFDNLERSIDLYKLMVASSEALVNRRQTVNTFFLTANGAILTATGLLLGNGTPAGFLKWGFLVLGITGLVLASAWHSLILSFGQLNTGKFEVINRIEELLPVAVYLAEWKALDEGKNPKKYRSFTLREAWVPSVFIAIYSVVLFIDVIAIFRALVCP